MHRVRLLAPVMLIAVLAGSCGSGSDGEPVSSPTSSATSSTTSTPATAEATEAPTSTTSEASTPTPWPTAPADLDPDDPPTWSVEVVASYDHDPSAFTQGLELLPDGSLLESTGLRGFSSIRVVDLETGTVGSSAALDPTEFGEGATLVGDTIVQLTWQEKIARRWRLPDLTPLEPFTYEGEGWGLCNTGDRLAMTDGTSELEWRDLQTFDVVERVDVRLRGTSVGDLNELECIGDIVLANVWRSDQIVVIRTDGAVVATIDASELVAQTPVALPGNDVLNGIADLGDGTLLLGGKRWPVFYRVRLTEG